MIDDGTQRYYWKTLRIDRFWLVSISFDRDSHVISDE